jgi:HD-GYP domain-containing protein (c-di-GMP phosphodiesterase class II)
VSDAQAIIVTDSKEIEDLYILHLKANNLEIIPKASAEETTSFLEILPDVGVIICEAQIGSEKTACDFIAYIKKKELEMPLIVLGKTDIEESDKIKIVKDPNDWKLVASYVSKYLHVLTEEESTDGGDIEFTPIPVKYFLLMSNMMCDVYIRLKKKGEYQYIKRIHKDDNFDNATIEKYISQGLTDFYIPKDYKENFMNFVSNKLVGKLESDKISVEDKVNVNAHSFEMATEEIKQMGFTTANVQLAEATIKSMQKVFEKSPKINSLFNAILSSKGSYAFQHSQLTSIICSQIVENSKWGSEVQKEKLSFIAFFHDISLAEKPDLMRIHTEKELTNAALSEQDKALVLEHALESAKMIQSFPQLPMGADIIIKQHHGSLDGRGFVTNFSSQLSPLAQVFLVAEDFSRIVIEKKESGDKLVVKDILEDMLNLYDKEALRKVVRTLWKSLQ